MNIIYQNHRYNTAGEDHMEPMIEGPTIPIPWDSPELIVEPTDAEWFAAEIAETLDNPATSFWLKRAYAQCVGRDPLDAKTDAETLARLLNARWMQIKSEGPRTIWDSDGTDGPVLICPPPSRKG